MLSTLYKFYVDLVLCGIIADVLCITLLVKSVSLSSTGALKQVVHSMAIVVAGRYVGLRFIGTFKFPHKLGYITLLED